MRSGIRIFAGAFAVVCGFVDVAFSLPAQEPIPPLSDKERLTQCDRDLCGIVKAQSPDGLDLSCELSQTWMKEEIAEAVKKGRLSWPFGDARCSVQLDVGRALLVPALTEPSYTLKVPPQPVMCRVGKEGDEEEIKANMAPEVRFKNGKATSVSLGVQDIEGNAIIRNVIWAAWKIESNFGFFQQDFVKGVNKYITEHCRSLPQ
jgi:hypothetical protein